jgi:hypothetical protein
MQGQRVTPVAGAWVVDREAVTYNGQAWKGEGFPLALFNQPESFSNGSAKVDFKLIDGKDDFSAGLVFGHTGGSSYFYVRYNTKDGNVALWRIDGTARTVIKHGEQHEQLAKNAWHTLELVLDGRKVRASVNGGKLPVEHELDTAVTGKLGLWAKPEVTTAFRNLRTAPR